jgi:hypothetical protein
LRLRPRRVDAATRPRGLLRRRRVCAGFEDGAAWRAEQRRILTQARHNPIDVRNLRAAEAPDIRRASHLLFHRPGVLRVRGTVERGERSDRESKAGDDALRCHV